MKKKLAAMVLAAVLAGTLTVGCGTSSSGTDAGSGSETQEKQEASAAEEKQKENTGEQGQKADSSEELKQEESSAAEGTLEEALAAKDNQADAGDTGNTAAAQTDQEAADAVAALIDAIYVQEWTEETDMQIEAARAGWDALTDEQKALVQGEEADPDYFGRDTGDASADDPLNADEIGENELLVVSFGTSFNESRARDIGGIEAALQQANPDWSVRRAFTSQIIINHIQARDGEKIDNVEQALARAKNNGVKNLVLQPTHLMHGAEYDDLAATVQAAAGNFESVRIAEPLLGEAVVDASVINEDKEAVAKAVVAQAMEDAGYADAAAAAEDGTALVLMGHGTAHAAKVAYSQMQKQMDALAYTNVYVGTVEGEPEETACDAIIEKVQEGGFKKVILRPLMVVAGDHANNDMAGDDEDSWKSRFTADGSFETVETQIAGLGRIPAISEIYKAHTAAVLAAEPDSSAGAADSDTALADGTYTASFTTDGSMFHVNEAKDGKGILTVKDGKMTIHVSLTSKNIVNLFVGTAEDAQKEGAELLMPSEDEVTYSDGTKETVNGFDIPVPAIGEEFDCALVGTKGKWYDHKVRVSDPAAVE